MKLPKGASVLNNFLSPPKIKKAPWGNSIVLEGQGVFGKFAENILVFAAIGNLCRVF